MEDIEYNKQQEDYVNGADEENDEDNDNEDDEDESQDQSHSRQQYQSSLGPNGSRSANAPSTQSNGYSHNNIMNGPVLAPPTSSQPGPYDGSADSSENQNPRNVGISGAAAPFVPQIRPEAITASVYDIVPTIAAPHSTSINAIAATPDLRFVFSGGSDGYIRKFNWVETANGKLMLTVAQRHPFVDSVTKAGVLVSYWENEEPNCAFSTVQMFDLGGGS